jgi:hypothetical protein
MCTELIFEFPKTRALAVHLASGKPALFTFAKQFPKAFLQK